MRRVAFGMAALLVASQAVGCGDAQPTRVVVPRPIERENVALYPPGSPQRSTLELMRAAQFNDPETTRRFLAPTWGLSRQEIAAALDSLRTTALTWQAPRSLTATYHGRRTTVVTADVNGHRVRLWWRRDRARWRLTGIGAGSEKLARDITNVIFFANHPELEARPFRAGEVALTREWLRTWARVRRLGR
jgi:hypothetical protein